MSPSERLIDDTSNAGAFPAPSFPVYRTEGSDRSWPEIDAGLLEDKRGPVPAFPIDLLPQPWRGWVAETARAAGAPADYVAQSVLATVAGLCAGASVRVTPAWSEPLVLRQALVGGPASGKSPALAPMRAMLTTIEADEPDEPAKAALQWHDESAHWLRDGGSQALEAWGETCPPSVLGTLTPEEVQKRCRMAAPGLPPASSMPGPSCRPIVRWASARHRTMRTC